MKTFWETRGLTLIIVYKYIPSFCFWATLGIIVEEAVKIAGLQE